MTSAVLAALTAEQATAQPEPVWTRTRRPRPDSLAFDFEAGGSGFTLELVETGSGVALSVTAPTDEARRILRNALVGRFALVRSGGERHVLERPVKDSSPSALLASVAGWIGHVSRLVNDMLGAVRPGGDVPPEFLNLLWWDERPNFGDAAGPWLAARLSGLTPVNGRGRRLGSPPLASVGSIAGWLEQDGSRIWGSGLMGPLGAESLERLRGLRDIRVHAVRGRHTREELMGKAGWEVPEVFGDPALLLPQFLPEGQFLPADHFIAADRHSSPPIAVVPHLDHRSALAHLTGPGVQLVDVREGVEAVVAQIAGAQVCISSSLHGIIVAQAYGVPWVWLRISDLLISGDTFKFEDFFTTIDAAAVSACDLPARSLTQPLLTEIAARASLPETTVDVGLVLESFPFRRACSGAGQFTG